MDQIIEVLKAAYMALVKHNLPSLGINKSNGQLADFATTKKDVARGISRMPLELSRIHEESNTDWKSPQNVTPTTARTKQLSESERFMENLNESITHRNIAQRTAFKNVPQVLVH